MNERAMPTLRLAAAFAFALCVNAQAATLQTAEKALDDAVQYFTEQVSTQGSYLWTYSEDLSVRKGEGDATETMGWVQPPGTPAVGEALLDAYEATGKREYIEAARQTAKALHDTQLTTGGWDYRIEFHPDQRKQWNYRVDPRQGARDRTVFDDDNTQSALRFLMRIDRLEEGRLKEAREAVEYGLKAVLKAQYPNGAWPQVYAGETWSAEERPSLKAKYPESWSRTYVKTRYSDFYTFNDNAIRDIVETLIIAAKQYGDSAYEEAVLRAAQFILDAQMPEPQPAWAQQYNYQMEPDWARKFEPPSISGGESSGTARLLIDLYLEYGREEYFNAALKAAEWYRRSSVGENRWARFYELRANKPLYFNKRYEIVDHPNDLPTHYSFQGGYGVSSLIRYAEEVKAEGREAYLARQNAPLSDEKRREKVEELKPRVMEIVNSLDDQGRWVEDGQIRCRTFNRNVRTLAEFIRLSKSLRR